MTPVHLEADLEAYFYKKVRLIGGIPVKLLPTISGMPDRMVLLPVGQVKFVELKTKTGKLRPIQEHFHMRMRKLGHTVTVLHGRDEVDFWIRSLFPDREDFDA